MHLLLFYSLVFAAFILIDLLFYYALKQTFGHLNRGIYAVTVGSGLLAIAVFILVAGPPKTDPDKYASYFVLFSLALLFYIPKLIYVVFAVLQKILYLLVPKTKRIMSVIGIFIGGLVFCILLYGIIWGKYNYKVSQIDVYVKDLPAAFENFRIVQFSDAHLGSFKVRWKVRRGLSYINQQSPDLIVFTGDLINVSSKEALPYIPYFKDLHATIGKYAVLGNHDMNDYRKLDSMKVQPDDLARLDSIYNEMGFTLLRNEHRKLAVGQDTIALIGVDNWGLPPFKQNGDLFKSIEGLHNDMVQILLSHDPTHWDEEVVPFTSIDLTLSGHTHGMQFGINTSRFQWSPIKRLYKRWIGLHQVKEQYLYVNSGFGYIGFSGRVGIRPEISVFTLKRK